MFREKKVKEGTLGNTNICGASNKEESQKRLRRTQQYR
jgi:hypothetical protein